MNDNNWLENTIYNYNKNKVETLKSLLEDSLDMIQLYLYDTSNENSKVLIENLLKYYGMFFEAIEKD